MPRPSRRAERTRQILDATAEVILAKGLGNATMDEIANAAQLNKSTIYLYFDNQIALFQALLDDVLEQEFAVLDFLIADSERSSTEKLQFLIEQSILFADDSIALQPLYYEYYAEASRNPNVRASLQVRLKKYMEKGEAIIQQGIDHGEFRPVDVEEYAGLYFGVGETIVLFGVLDGNSDRYIRLMKAGTDLILRDLAPQN